MIEFMVGFAFYLTFFSTESGLGTVMQLAAIATVCGAALYSLVIGRFEPRPPSAAECVMYVLGINYVFLGLFGEEDAVFLAMAFLLTIIGISVVCRSVSLETLLDICGRVALAGIATVIVFDHSQAQTALSSGLHASSAGIVRFMPLGLHPDLTGYVFGACAWLMARRVVLATLVLERLAMIGGVLAACVFVLAASSRSSLIALSVSTCVAVFIEYGFLRLFTLRWVRWASVFAVVIGVAFASKISTFFTTMLELDSSLRGVSSGGSGRADLWARGIATLFQDPSVFLFGGGYRSSSIGLIGFSTESSYISILLDSGVIFGAAVILVFWYAPFKALRVTSRTDRHATPLILLASLMTFLIVESTFNRYLLAIGNPASLMSLMILLALSLRPNAANTGPAMPHEWTSAQPVSK